MSASLIAFLARAVGYFALGHFVPLYAVYALLLAEHGMTRAATSSLFAVWSVTSFVLEVPSGAWADVVSRRALLVVSALLTAAGLTAWTVGGTYVVYAGGFVLCGAGGAVMSGTCRSRSAAVGPRAAKTPRGQAAQGLRTRSGRSDR